MRSPNISVAVAVADCGGAPLPLHNAAFVLPPPQRASADWPSDADDDDDEAEPDADFDDSSLDDFDLELDDEPDPEPGDFWGDVDDEEF